MDWKLVDVTKDTNHRFLNEYTLHYEVSMGDKTRPYDYFVASRNEPTTLRSITRDYSRPDGVVMCLYEIDSATQEVSVLFTKQFRPALGAYMTSFPAGLLDPEDPDMLVAAKREAKEEAGVEIEDMEILAPACPTSSGLSDELDGFILARIVGKEEKKLEDFEDISTRLVPLKDVPAMMKDPAYHIPLPVRLCLHYLLERFAR